MPTTLITGATGALGPTLAAHLVTAGWAVRATSRHVPPPGTFPPGVTHFAGDITDSAALDGALTGVEVVFHLAAKLHIRNPDPALNAEYERVNVTGTQAVAEAAAHAGVRRLVVFSTVKVYGTARRVPVAEDHPPQPRTIYARTKLAGESAARSVPGLEVVVLRLSATYGPRMGGSWARLVDAIGRGRYLPVGGLDNVRSLTYAEDVARAARLAATDPRAAGGVYNLVGHEAASMRDILGAIYAAQGRRLPPLHIPAALALSGAWTVERGLSLLGRRASLVQAVRQLTGDEVYSGAALRDLGFAPSVTLAEGWARTIKKALD
jgi:nucleoside-diphosphate-sugar epimerase